MHPSCSGSWRATICCTVQRQTTFRHVFAKNLLKEKQVFLLLPTIPFSVFPQFFDKTSFATWSQQRCRRVVASGRIVVLLPLHMSVDFRFTSTRRHVSSSPTPLPSGASTLTRSVRRTPTAFSTFTLVVFDVPRPTTCVVTPSSFLLTSSDLFAHSPLWLPLALERSLLDPNVLRNCSARQRTSFFCHYSLLRCSQTFAARGRTPSTHYENDVARSSNEFLVFYSNLSPDSESLLHRSARSRRPHETS